MLTSIGFLVLGDWLNSLPQDLEVCGAWDEPIYGTCDVTLGMFVILFIQHALIHKESKSAITDKLKLIQALLPKPNIAPRTWYTLCSTFRSYTDTMVKVSICPSEDYIFRPNDDFSECPRCGADRFIKNSTQPIKFMYLKPLKQLIREKLRNQVFKAATKHYINEEHPADSRMLEILSRFPHLKKDSTSVWGVCTDGLSLFSSSKFEIWPVFLRILSFPPEIANKMENLPLVALWPGIKPISSDLLLLALSDEFVELFHGTEMDGEIVHAILLWATADLDARAWLQHVTLHRGYYGCPYCLANGKYLDGRVRYPNEDPLPSLRTHEDTVASRCEHSKTGFYLSNVLEKIPYWDIINSWAIDAMHLLFLNIVPSLVSLWLAPVSRGSQRQAYQVEGCLDSVSEFLSGVILPHDFGRSPLNFKNRENWKAEQWKSFFIFFICPAFENVLPKKVWIYSFFVGISSNTWNIVLHKPM